MIHTLEVSLLKIEAWLKVDQFPVQSEELQMFSISTACDFSTRTHPPSVDTVSRSRCGRLAFAFPLHLHTHTLGVYLCSHERALQSQMCEGRVNKLGFHCQSSARMHTVFDKWVCDCDLNFKPGPPTSFTGLLPPKRQTARKRSVRIFDNEIETETFVLNNVISNRRQASLGGVESC